MRKNPYFLNILLTAELAAVLLVCMVLRAFFPAVILPKGQIPGFVLVSLAALVAEHYLAPGGKRRWGGMAALAALAFGLLPWCACFVSGLQALKLALLGGAVFTLTAAVFSAITDRLSTGPAARAAAVFSAVSLYLAAQCFQGMGL